jgi:NAD(P)-dependent dehydrogenase (short-subunit alcohol dehydrogenase family)
MKQVKPILVTGATGYIGGRLISALLDAGYSVRAMGRSLNKLQGHPWSTHHPWVEVVQGDVLDPGSLHLAFSGYGTDYYLVHSMVFRKDKFEAAERQAAQHMVKAAAAAVPLYAAGLGGILYWYLLYPFHECVFFGMLKAIARVIEKPIIANPVRFTPRLHKSREVSSS